MRSCNRRLNKLWLINPEVGACERLFVLRILLIFLNYSGLFICTFAIKRQKKVISARLYSSANSA